MLIHVGYSQDSSDAQRVEAVNFLFRASVVVKVSQLIELQFDIQVNDGSAYSLIQGHHSVSGDIIRQLISCSLDPLSRDLGSYA